MECWKIFEPGKIVLEFGLRMAARAACCGFFCGYPAAVSHRGGAKNVRKAAKRPKNLLLWKVCKCN